MEQLNYNLLFRWFIGLSADEPVSARTVFSHNRYRMLALDVAAEFLYAVLKPARAAAPAVGKSCHPAAFPDLP